MREALPFLATCSLQVLPTFLNGDSAVRTTRFRERVRAPPGAVALDRVIGCYLISTVAPCSSSLAFILAASSFDDLLLHGLGRAVHQVLRLLEAEAGQLADDLDDLDLLVAGAGEHDVELGLLLDRRRGAAAPPPIGIAIIGWPRR